MKGVGNSGKPHGPGHYYYDYHHIVHSRTITMTIIMVMTVTLTPHGGRPLHPRVVINKRVGNNGNALGLPIFKLGIRAALAGVGNSGKAQLARRNAN